MSSFGKAIRELLPIKGPRRTASLLVQEEGEESRKMNMGMLIDEIASAAADLMGGNISLIGKCGSCGHWGLITHGCKFCGSPLDPYTFNKDKNNE